MAAHYSWQRGKNERQREGDKHLYWEKRCKRKPLFLKKFYHLATFLEPENSLTTEAERNYVDWLFLQSPIPLAGAPFLETQ